MGLRQTWDFCPTSEYTPAQLEFMKEMRRYQDETGRKFPAYSEILQVLLGLGYRKR